MGKVQTVYQFKVTLLGINPPIWRQIQVPASYSFWDLHVAIQDAMGWLDYHLHEFQVKGRGHKQLTIGLPVDEDARGILAGWEVPLSRYFAEPGDSAEYRYDFGDSWRHTVLLDGILFADHTVKYPVCVAGARACPPEDCGGVSGYENTLKILASPDHEEYEETNYWLQNHAKNYFPYRPEQFDPHEVKFSKRKVDPEVKADWEGRRLSDTNAPPSRKTTAPRKEKPPRCPKCGATMDRKTATCGLNAGHQFWGCPHYPACNGNIREIHVD
jgi:ssDNA-binding Zn-finger/Zn-ribbon topoisomerase 1